MAVFNSDTFLRPGLELMRVGRNAVDLAATNTHRLNRLRKKGSKPYVILSEAKNLSFFSWS
jgi:hypothetical protein